MRNSFSGGGPNAGLYSDFSSIHPSSAAIAMGRTKRNSLPKRPQKKKFKGQPPPRPMPGDASAAAPSKKRKRQDKPSSRSQDDGKPHQPRVSKKDPNQPQQKV